MNIKKNVSSMEGKINKIDVHMGNWMVFPSTLKYDPIKNKKLQELYASKTYFIHSTLESINRNGWIHLH